MMLECIFIACGRRFQGRMIDNIILSISVVSFM